MDSATYSLLEKIWSDWSNMTIRTLRRILGISLGVLIFTLGVFVVGFGVGKFQVFPYSYVDPIIDSPLIKGRINQIFPNWERERDGGLRLLSTVFLSLEILEIDVPVPREGSGGGMTSFGDSVLLLSHDGTIFRLFENQIHATNIEVLDNGFDLFKKTAASKYAHLTHVFDYLRYNDILFFEEGGSKTLLVSFTSWNDARECYANRVARLDVDPNALDTQSVAARSGEWQVVFETSPCLPLKESGPRSMEGHMAGGRMAYLGNHKIALTSGDYGWEGLYGPEILSQNSQAEYGKVIELDVLTGKSRIISIGLRNPQGITTDDSGQLWTVEHGMRGGDELNKIVEGGNYGWPKVTLGTRYNRAPLPSAIQYGRHDSFVRPTYAWVPSVGISNLITINGFDPSWDGDLLAGSLAGKTLYRLRIKNERVVFAEPIYIGKRIRYVHQNQSGDILLWTDSKKILVLTKGIFDLASDYIDRVLQKSSLSSAKQERLKEAFEACQECHSLDTGDDIKAPSFSNLYASNIASSPYPAYSDSLKSLSGIWTRERLQEYLQDPNAVAPGTTMPATGLSDPEIISGIISILEEVKFGTGY